MTVAAFIVMGIWSFVLGAALGALIPPNDGSLRCRIAGHRMAQRDPRYLRNLPAGFVAFHACERCYYTFTVTNPPKTEDYQ